MRGTLSHRVSGDIELVIGAALYGAILSVIGLLSAGWGHGTYLPAAVFGAPLAFVPGLLFAIAPLLWWPFVAYTAGASRRPWLATGLLALHAAGVVFAFVFGTPFESTADQWERLGYTVGLTGPLVLIGMIVYVIGQAVAWSLLLIRWVSVDPR
jgi:hypothetical protein